jgi:hypothetical protein
MAEVDFGFWNYDGFLSFDLKSELAPWDSCKDEGD